MSGAPEPVRVGGRLAGAVAWATELHGPQTRKGTGVPYVAHLLAVASLVLEDGGDEDQAVAALLHDTIEDTPATAADVAARFGPQVAEWVVACSEPDIRPKPPWRERKLAYIRGLEDPSTPEPALRVAAADKLHNLRSMLSDHRQLGDELWNRFNADARDARTQLWYYERVSAVLARRLPGPLTHELSRAVDELRTLARAG